MGVKSNNVLINEAISITIGIITVKQNFRTFPDSLTLTLSLRSHFILYLALKWLIDFLQDDTALFELFFEVRIPLN